MLLVIAIIVGLAVGAVGAALRLCPYCGKFKRAGFDACPWCGRDS